MTRSRARVVLLALALDLLAGDPPNRIHPVAWMGALISLVARFRPREKKLAELAFGVGIALGGSALFAVTGRSLENWLLKSQDRKHNMLPAWLIEAVILKSTFSLRGLNQAARRVQSALEREDIAAARVLLSRHLVSRDISRLDKSLVSAAAIESVAENTSDGIIAPLLFYTAGGLPAALVYRFINTADSMLGYHTPELEWLGKVPARLDDLMNFLPSRLTAAAILLSAPFVRGSPIHCWLVVRRDAHKTQSPNAGYPMSAIAGTLNVELEKVGYYRLGSGGRKPAACDICRARRAMFIATAMAVGFIALLQFWLSSHASIGRKGDNLR